MAFKQRYNCPVTRKLMIKAPLIAFILLKSQHSPATFLHYANEVPIKSKQTVCQQVGLKTKKPLCFSFLKSKQGQKRNKDGTFIACFHNFVFNYCPPSRSKPERSQNIGFIPIPEQNVWR